MKFSEKDLKNIDILHLIRVGKMKDKIKRAKVEIIEYDDKYKDDLKRLSYEWLDKYDLLELEDKLMLDDPEEYILKDGGYIFFAHYENEIIGTFSLIPIGENIFELAKFAVIEKYQGQNIGNILLEKAINVVYSSNAKKIILFSNSKLKAAYKLYKKHGFKKVDLAQNKYETANIKMELILNT